MTAICWIAVWLIISIFGSIVMGKYIKWRNERDELDEGE